MSVMEKGDLVLVTGANGYIASHTVDQLLLAGFNVRGTVRTESKGKWLLEYCNGKYGNGRLEIVVVPDMATKGAFNEAVKDTAGVIHVASNLSLDRDPNNVIPSVISGINNTLEAADTEPKVKRFVFTSSSSAAITPRPDEVFEIDEDTWNNECVERAWAPPPYQPERAWDVYMASKTEAEQALWKFAEERKPHFEVNAVLPNANFGPILSPENQDASTAGWIVGLYNKGSEGLEAIPPQWFVDVRDTARLHVAALVNPSIKNERLFAFAEPWSWNSVLTILRKLRPDHEFPSDLPSNSKDLSKVLPRSRAEDILRKDFGRSGWTSLEEALKGNISHLK